MKDPDFHLALQQMMQGDQVAFQKVYESTKDHIYRTVYFLAQNKQDVSDIMSEVYIELFKSIPKYDCKQSFRSWLNGLVVRQVQNWHRNVWRKLRLFHRAKQLEIAHMLEIKEATIRSQLYTARKLLQISMEMEVKRFENRRIESSY